MTTETMRLLIPFSSYSVLKPPILTFTAPAYGAPVGGDSRSDFTEIFGIRKLWMSLCYHAAFICMILNRAVLTQYRRVTDRHMTTV